MGWILLNSGQEYIIRAKATLEVALPGGKKLLYGCSTTSNLSICSS
jgi:hypothetical protein